MGSGLEPCISTVGFKTPSPYAAPPRKKDVVFYSFTATVAIDSVQDSQSCIFNCQINTEGSKNEQNEKSNDHIGLGIWIKWNAVRHS